MKTKTKINKKRGMTLLIAVVLATTFLLISFAISRIALKEQILTFSAKDSEVAFYAADSGTECALYHDLKISDFFAVSEPTNPTINCSGATMTAISENPCGEGCYITKFAYNLGDSNDEDTTSCVIIKVIKTQNDDDTISTEIESRGYNNTCETPINHSSPVLNSGERNLERAIRITY